MTTTRDTARAARVARAGAIVLALASCRIEEVAPGDPRPPWQQIDRPSLAACGGCHFEVYEEWERSLHHRAWSNENVRAETNAFAQPGCRACHSPLPIFATGLDRRPAYRDVNQWDGVHCLSCHGLDDGVAAARDVPDAPCRPRRVPDFLTAQACWPCHEPTHHAFEEYDRSDARAVGVRCVDCHMQPTLHRAGRSHGPHGGLDPEFVKRAVAWQVERAGDVVRVTLRNRTGHKFPGEIPSRIFQIRFTADDAEPTWVTFRKPGKTETRADDRLDVDETRRLEFPIPAGARRLAIALLWKPFPLLPDEAAAVLGEWSEESGAPAVESGEEAGVSPPEASPEAGGP